MGKVCRSCCGSPPPNTTFSGTVAGCFGRALPGADVTINPSGTGNSTWTGTTDSAGNYAGSIYLAASGSVPRTIVDPAGTLQSNSNPAGLTTGISNNLGTVTLAAVTSLHCAGGCPRPIGPSVHVAWDANGSLSYTDSDLTWNGSWWTGSSTFTDSTFDPPTVIAETINFDGNDIWSGPSSVFAPSSEIILKRTSVDCTGSIWTMATQGDNSSSGATVTVNP